MEYVAACMIGYLLGSVPVALLVARRHGVDLRATGDGNPGAWNALEQLGPRRAWPAFAGDALKGTLAGLAGLALGRRRGSATPPSRRPWSATPSRSSPASGAASRS